MLHAQRLIGFPSGLWGFHSPAFRLASEARRISAELQDLRTEAACLHAIASAYDIVDQSLGPIVSERVSLLVQ